jgi:hypothetical protein
MTLENTGQLPPISSVLGLGGAFQKGLVFLLNLAWKSRFRLPVLITVGFMVLDVRMQLEINLDLEVAHVHNQDEDDGDDVEDDDDNDDDGDEEEEEEEEEDDDDDDDYDDSVEEKECIDTNFRGTSYLSDVENEVELESKLKAVNAAM